MSTLIVDVAKIKEVKEHPNADRLEIHKIKGWEVIAQKGLYKEGDIVVYCPIDAVLPIELSDAMEVTKYLSKQRVKTARLRGVYSQGLLIPTTFLPEGDYKIGDDVKDLLGITKYEPPPPPAQFAGTQLKKDDRFNRYTDIENIKNFPDVLKEGEQVIISEKIHGSNFRCGWVDEETFLAGSHNCNLKEDPDNIYWKIVHKYDLKEKMRGMGVILYGEVYGPGIQKNFAYDKKEVELVVFDVSLNGVYYDYYQAQEIYYGILGLPGVPVLYVGEWEPELVNLADGQSTISDTCIKEGIIIRPLVGRYDGTIGRVILKHISEKYLLKDYGDMH
jgi:RNA ligase (TIGR02306 family)